MNFRSTVLVFTVVHLLFISGLLAEDKRPVTPQDCATVRTILPIDMSASWHWSIKISPDGNHVGYLLQSPNLQTNNNDVELHIRTLSQSSSESDRLVGAGDISDFSWLSDGQSVAVLIREDGRRVLQKINFVTGAKQLLLRADTDIAEYSIDRSGSTIVYTTVEAPLKSSSVPTADDISHGYRISFETKAALGWEQSSVYVSKYREGIWTKPKLIEFTSPLSGRSITNLARAGNSPLQPSLSPDGSKLLVRYWDFSVDMPQAWSQSDYIKIRNSSNMIQGANILILYDLTTGKTSFPLNSPYALSPGTWSPDGKFFAVVGFPEIGSPEEGQSKRDGSLGHSRSALLFSVQLDNSLVTIVSRHVAWPWEPPLYFAEDGTLLVRTESKSITRFVPTESGWKSAETSTIPLKAELGSVAANGRYVVGDYSDTTTPPELFLYSFGKDRIETFAELNPQFDQLSFAKPTEVRWTTAEGLNETGILLLPPGYKAGNRYPLVIQTKPFSSQFVCGFGNDPSFTPQPIANAGIMYLGPGSLSAGSASGPKQNVADFQPKGYPGGISEAAFAMSTWDSAVKALSDRGMIDENKVGIIGFSRTGWYTEFILAHSKIHYRAATVADNIQYSVGEYWIAKDARTMKEHDNVFGGPPYGATLKNWLDYSVSFNLDKFHTPLLMEEMGYGLSSAVDPITPPIGLASAYEVFSGLNHLNKPVELYYYPNESHTPSNPQARLATMQRNLDWYRFWLQGYERPNPEDPEQYKRWGHLRELQDADDMATGQSPANSSKPN